MNIAVACDGLEVAPYFSQSSSYTCYTVTCGVIAGSKNMPALDQPIDRTIALFHDMGIDTLIVGRIEYDIANLICHSGIEVVAGAEGYALDVARSYLTKTLAGICEPCKVEPAGKDDSSPSLIGS